MMSSKKRKSQTMTNNQPLGAQQKSQKWHTAGNTANPHGLRRVSAEKEIEQ